MKKLGDALAGVDRLGMDTNPVIYFVQQSPLFFPVTEPIFQRVSEGSITAVTSALTLMECLVLPYSIGNTQLEQTFTDLLLHTNGVETVAVGAVIAARAARFRSRYRLKPADALQIATALESGCDAFLTADSDFNRVTEIPVLDIKGLEL